MAATPVTVVRTNASVCFTEAATEAAGAQQGNAGTGFLGEASESIQTSRDRCDRQNLDGDRLGKAGSLRTPTLESYAGYCVNSTAKAIGEQGCARIVNSIAEVQ